MHEELSMNVPTPRIIMEVLFIQLLMIVFAVIKEVVATYSMVVIYLPSKGFSIIIILLAKFGSLRFFAKSPCFSYGKIQNLQVLKILG